MILPTVEGSALPFNMPSKSFSELGLPKAVHDNLISASGGDKPTTLDTFAGPLVIAGRDVALIGAAPGGDEQVAPLMAPLIAQMIKSSTRKSNGEHAPPNGGGGGTPRALIVAPSRELVTYAARSARTLLAGTAFRVVHACGGTTIDASAAECGNRVDLLVATPGRLLDLRERGAVALGAVKHLLIVAADALFDAGFDEHMRRLILEEGLPPLLDRQTAVSCALLSPAVERVVSHLLRPNMVKLTAVKPWLAAACAPLARQAVRFAEDRGKQPALAALLEQSGVSSKASGDRDGAPARGPSSGLTLVVVGTRRHCEAVLYFLQGEGFAAGACPLRSPQTRREGSAAQQLRERQDPCPGGDGRGLAGPRGGAVPGGPRDLLRLPPVHGRLRPPPLAHCMRWPHRATDDARHGYHPKGVAHSPRMPKTMTS